MYGKLHVDKKNFLTKTNFSFREDPKDVLQKVCPFYLTVKKEDISGSGLCSSD